MTRKALIAIVAAFAVNSCVAQRFLLNKTASTDSISGIEMNLSAFGVESNSYPSIAVYIDFRKDSAVASRSYDNPAFKPSTYTLSKTEMA